MLIPATTIDTLRLDKYQRIAAHAAFWDGNELNDATKTKGATLNATSFFLAAARTTVELLLEGAFLQKFPAHLELAREGERADFLHVVIDGSVEIFATHCERETTLEIDQAAQHIHRRERRSRPHLSQIGARSRTARILLIPALSVRKAMVEDGAFATTIATELARRISKQRPGTEESKTAVQPRTIGGLAAASRSRNSERPIASPFHSRRKSLRPMWGSCRKRFRAASRRWRNTMS